MNKISYLGWVAIAFAVVAIVAKVVIPAVVNTGLTYMLGG